MKPRKYDEGPCMCEHVGHDDWLSQSPHAHAHAYGATRMLTHWVRPISGAVCATCAVSIMGAFPDEVEELA